MKKDKPKTPEWVLKQRKKGTEILKRGDNYYLSEVTSVWDKELKRPRKVTGRYLGKITPNGVIAPKHERVKEGYKQISVKEYGATHFVRTISTEVEDALKKHYPADYKELLTLGLFRLIDGSPLKRLSFYYHSSFLSETLRDTRSSAKFLGPFLREIGSKRESMKNFMKEFLVGSEFAAIDLSDVITYSKGVNSAMLGYNRRKTFLPQLNLLLIFSLDKMRPGFFRILPGGIRDVSTISATIKELKIKDTIIIADKGFTSDNNAKELSKSGLKYILPLKRNSSLIDYGLLKEGSRKDLGGVFTFDKGHIWYFERKDKGERLITYLDERLKAEETTTLVDRLERLKEKDDVEDEIKDLKSRLYENDFVLGTITVRTNCDKDAQKSYELLKSRIDIEKSFDIFKNILEADKAFMRDDNQIEGFLFMSFVALLLYYNVYAKLIEKDLLKKYSVRDVTEYLKRVHALSLNSRSFNNKVLGAD